MRGLVLADTQPGADDEPGRARREALARSVERDGMQALVDGMLPKLLAPEARPEVKSLVEQMIRANAPRGAAAALRGMALREDSSDALACYPGPALIVVGEKDPITPPAKGQELANLLARSRLVVLPGTGHLSNLEAPRAFNLELEAFLDSLER